MERPWKFVGWQGCNIPPPLTKFQPKYIIKFLNAYKRIKSCERLKIDHLM